MRREIPAQQQSGSGEDARVIEGGKQLWEARAQDGTLQLVCATFVDDGAYGLHRQGLWGSRTS